MTPVKSTLWLAVASLALGAFSDAALADATFRVRGRGTLGSSYEYNITIDGQSTGNVQVTDNDDQLPNSFVQTWRLEWNDVMEMRDPDAFEFPLEGGPPFPEGKFKLIGKQISFKIGDIGATEEVVGRKGGKSFNPDIFDVTPEVPTLTPWGVFISLLLMVGTFFVIRRRAPQA